MTPLTKYYAKIFGVGLAIGGAMEVLLIKSNYYQMLAASEAKQNMKDLVQEQEDLERYQRMKAAASSSSS
ncbi:uncharacterized protein EV154DRAFT_608259 [Mucor mucedo]|uniref:uncharacterized protein n=1 Tax=Mucor mucedo TaxID=29922 RepID=UPI00221FE812|nr:uncharacterized protein EV154DRAFT_608259 [Mucor mucedo]KAI7864947.1 hypothetical protein EV154DRAFT_608259 [Mucor mucedo]